VPIALSSVRSPLNSTILGASYVAGDNPVSATSYLHNPEANARNAVDAIGHEELMIDPVTTFGLLVLLLLLLLPFLPALWKRSRNILAHQAKKAAPATGPELYNWIRR
jgi:hypothetical protein